MFHCLIYQSYQSERKLASYLSESFMYAVVLLE